MSVSILKPGATTTTRPQDTLGSIHLLRWTGLAGALGGLILLMGDMLAYFGAVNLTPGDSYVASMTATMGQVSPARLLASAALGPVGCWFYMLGAWHIHLALRGAGSRLANVTFGAFAALVIWIAVFHSALAPFGFGAQTARSLGYSGEVAALALKLPAELFQTLILVLIAPFIVFTVGFVTATLRGGSLYPRWVAVVTPTFVLLASQTLESITPPSTDLLYALYMVVVGGSANLGLLLFFSLSTALLWNGKRPA